EGERPAGGPAMLPEIDQGLKESPGRELQGLPPVGCRFGSAEPLVNRVEMLRERPGHPADGLVVGKVEHRRRLGCAGLRKLAALACTEPRQRMLKKHQM